jgi:hypothetical protein
MSTLNTLATAQPPPSQWTSASLVLLLVGIVIMITLGRVVARDIATLAGVLATASASIFASLRTLIVVLLVGLLVLALAYFSSRDNARTSSGPPHAQATTTSATDRTLVF